MSKILKDIVYSKDTIEFTTVAVQYCRYLEETNSSEQKAFVDVMTKMLPLLYLKAQMLPETDLQEDAYPETTVSEDDYNYTVSKISNILKEEDTYLEVFLQDMKYSETPIAANISEDLTDIYQDLKNYISIYERGITEIMNDALYVCTENFRAYWGQKLVNVLRALHSLKYGEMLSAAEDEITEEDGDEYY